MSICQRVRYRVHHSWDQTIRYIAATTSVLQHSHYGWGISLVRRYLSDAILVEASSLALILCDLGWEKNMFPMPPNTFSRFLQFWNGDTGWKMSLSGPCMMFKTKCGRRSRFNWISTGRVIWLQGKLSAITISRFHPLESLAPVPTIPASAVAPMEYVNPLSANCWPHLNHGDSRVSGPKGFG